MTRPFTDFTPFCNSPLTIMLNVENKTNKAKHSKFDNLSTLGEAFHMSILELWGVALVCTCTFRWDLHVFWNVYWYIRSHMLAKTSPNIGISTILWTTWVETLPGIHFWEWICKLYFQRKRLKLYSHTTPCYLFINGVYSLDAFWENGFYRWTRNARAITVALLCSTIKKLKSVINRSNRLTHAEFTISLSCFDHTYFTARNPYRSVKRF